MILDGPLDQYRSVRLEGWLTRVLEALTGRSAPLKDLRQLVAESGVAGRHYVGLRSAPINQICGSEGRTTDFDCHFNPLRSNTQQRWLNVMLARWMDVPLKPVELIQIGDRYFVRDGHHRISVARALGETCIDAEITTWELANASAQATASRLAIDRARSPL